MYLIDTHTHIYDEAFDSDIDEVIQRCLDSGIKQVILPGIDTSCYQSLMALANKYPDFAHPCIGLHPTSVDANWKEELQHVVDNLDTNTHYAIGEIGLDGHWSKEFMNEQKQAFIFQIELAVKNNLPIIVHLRDASEELYEVLDSLSPDLLKELRGVFHAFSGSYETYRRIKQYGNFLFGIGGVVTYKKAGLAETLTKVPLEDLILETDAPWLTPVPHRGRRNEPSYIVHIAERIATIKECEIEDVARITTANAKTLFNLS